MVHVAIRKTQRLCGQVCAPSSKSYTQRMVIAAALSHGISKVSNPLLSEDTEATFRAVTFRFKSENFRGLLGIEAPRV
jgi:3-phosphoshikimate 1-carboxyvinyltransferase